MMQKRVFVPVALLMAALASIAASVFLASRPMQVTLVFHPFVGREVLVLNDFRYANPGGEGIFKIRSFQFFLSNIRLLADSGVYAEHESYHLARFDNDDGEYRIVFENVPRRNYQYVEFGIGVDAAANGTIEMQGDLDPNGRMAWSWDVGYKFVLLEGGLMLNEIQYPLVYHVGFDENYKSISIPLAAGLKKHRAVALDFRVDLLQMFTANALVNMTALPSVKFDLGDAKRLADNYAGMIALCPGGCGP
ncbi:MAG: MbnP family protein [Halioglobus sp.]